MLFRSLRSLDAGEIAARIAEHVEPGSVVMTDQFGGYSKLSKAYEHHTVNHAQGEYVRGTIHTNTIEGFWGLFKRAVYGIYHNVSDQHLHRYLAMAAFRYSNREEGEAARVNHLLEQVSGKRLTYKALIA